MLKAAGYRERIGRVGYRKVFDRNEGELESGEEDVLNEITPPSPVAIID